MSTDEISTEQAPAPNLAFEAGVASVGASAANLSLAAASAATMEAPYLEEVAPVPGELREFRQRTWIAPTFLALEAVTVAASLAIGFSVCLALPIASASCTAPSHASILPVVVLLPVVLGLAHVVLGYDLTATERSKRRFVAALSTMIALALVDLAIRPTITTLIFPGVSLGFALFIPAFCGAQLRKKLVQRGVWGIPVLILGAGRTGKSVVKKFRERPELGFVPIGMLDDNPSKWGRVIEGVPVVGPLEFSYSNYARKRAQAVVLTLPNLAGSHAADLVDELPYPTILIVPNLAFLGRAWPSARDLGDIYAIEIKKKLFLRRFNVAKRIIDYGITLPLFLLSLPLIGFFGVWIKLASRGPVFFRQERYGLDGRRFDVVKLRTMLVDAEERLEAYLAANPEARSEWYKHYKLKKDPRVLPVIGKFLRMTSLDELPQFWNILRGDMSLVGPRPFTGYHLACFDDKFRSVRQSVRPGLTGLWQVEARSDGDTSAQQRFDTEYLRNWSLWLDVTLVFRTIRAVITARGAY